MGKNNTSSRGFGSKAKREFRIELFKKTVNRKQNQEGCTNRNIIKNGKLKNA
jgi:hypothetical protein